MNPEDLKAFYESFHNKKMNQEEYEWATKEDEWLNEVLDGIKTGKNTTWERSTEKRVQEWTLITREEFLEKYGSGTMWIFKPIYRLDGTGMTFGEMRVTKINLSHAGNGFTYKHGSDVADLGLFPKHITREMWETLVASGEYVEYNKPQERRRPSAHGKKNSNYALEA